MMRLPDSDLETPILRMVPSNSSEAARASRRLEPGTTVPDPRQRFPGSSLDSLSQAEKPALSDDQERESIEAEPAPGDVPQSASNGSQSNGSQSNGTQNNGSQSNGTQSNGSQSNGGQGNGHYGPSKPNASKPSASEPKPSESEPPEDNTQERGFLPVLRNRNFLTLWSGQIFSQLADKVYLVLMIALIAARFQDQNQTISGWVSSIMIAFTIPAVLFGSLAGAFVDRWFKRSVLVLTNLLRGGLVFSVPFLLWVTKDWAPINGLPVGFLILLAITFLVSTLTQFFAPAEQAVIPLIVDRRHLLSANSLYTTTAMASVIIGFAVGEPLLAIADTIAAQVGLTAIGIGKELVVGSGYAIAGLILILLRTQEKRGRQAGVETEPPHVLQDLQDGFRYLSQHKQVRAAMLQLVILFSTVAALSVLAVRLAEVIPEIKSSQFGFLLAAGGVGLAIGATIIGHSGQRFTHAQLSIVGSLGMAASLFGLSVFPERLIPTLLLITMLGGFAAIIGVPMQTTIQEETPEEMRGKVFGLQNNAVNIALSLPLALAGVAETFLGLRVVFLGLSVIVVAGGVFTWYIARTSSHESASNSKS